MTDSFVNSAGKNVSVLLDSNGNVPVVVRGTYSATPPTLADGVAGALQTDINGNMKVTLATALSKLIDSIASYDATDALMNGSTLLTPKFAKIVASSSGATQIVPAVTAKKIRVLGYVVVANAAVNAKFQSHVTPTDLDGLLYFGVNGGAVAPYNKVGWFETLVGEALDINLSGAVALGGHLVYVEVS